LEAHHKTIKGP